ncbi:MAG: alpha/beta hydrolase [Synechococcales cyanobacterium RM1_1_8]|nr:alpha/beta hydrolase [Synechococcales cyanobacterium RM1_1_8]
MKRAFQQPINLTLGLTVGLGILFSGTLAQAAEQITLIIGPLNRSISVSEIEALAQGTEATGDLKTVLKFAKQTSQSAGTLLSQELPFDLVQADKLLNSSLGESLLNKLGQIISPRSSGQAGAQAMRSALIMSLADDGKASAIEVMRRYPTDMRVDIGALQNASEEFKDIPQLLRGLGR